VSVCHTHVMTDPLAVVRSFPHPRPEHGRVHHGGRRLRWQRQPHGRAAAGRGGCRQPRAGQGGVRGHRAELWAGQHCGVRSPRGQPQPGGPWWVAVAECHGVSRCCRLAETSTSTANCQRLRGLRRGRACRQCCARMYMAEGAIVGCGWTLCGCNPAWDCKGTMSPRAMLLMSNACDPCHPPCTRLHSPSLTRRVCIQRAR
jgi:hypothetical protein